MYLILDAAESFSVSGVKRCSLLTESQREVLLRHAINPLSLKHLVRLAIRQNLGSIGPLMVNGVLSLPIPTIIKRYLLYDI